MKTPRDILLKKHQAVQPKLDRLRHEALGEVGTSRCDVPARAAAGGTNLANALNGSSEAPLNTARTSRRDVPTKHSFTFFLSQLWRELVLPSRCIWSGLAAAWVVIIFVNLSDSETETIATTAQSSQPTPEVIATLQERQRLLGEFLAEATIQEPEEPPRSILHPRSERRLIIRVA